MIAGDLLFIGAVFLFFAAPFLAIWSVGPHQVIGRARYGLLYFLLLCLSLLLTLTDFIEPNDWERFFRSPVGVISVAVSIFLLTRIAAMRANDAGLHKQVCYAFFVPVVGSALGLALLFLPTETKASYADDLELPRSS